MLRPTLFLNFCDHTAFPVLQGNKTASEHADIIGIDSSRYIRIPDADSLLQLANRQFCGQSLDRATLITSPTNGRTASRSWILSLTHNYLMRLDPVSMEVVPDLQQPSSVLNKLEFTYSIRPDARWDGWQTCYSGRCSLYIKSNKMSADR